MASDLFDSDGRRQAARLTAFDQRIAGVRRWYESLDREERERFRNWVDHLTSAGVPFDAEAFWMEVEVIVVSNYEETDSGEWKQDAIRIDPAVLANALSSWDEGEEYGPNFVIRSGE